MNLPTRYHAPGLRAWLERALMGCLERFARRAAS